MPIPSIHVAICTYQPRPEALRRTLEGLAAQTLAVSDWEFTLIDNASTPAISADDFDLSFHPRASVLREEKLGLTQARLAAIRHSKADLILFVDDDNILAPDYLEQALLISEKMPNLGVFGAAVIEPEFGAEPPSFLKGPDRLAMLALREESSDLWGSTPGTSATPWGAGLVVRRELASHYQSKVESSQMRSELDRKGESLNSAGDDEFSWLGHRDLGLGHGVFRSLKMIHLIPPERLEVDYLLRLAEGHAFSRRLLHHINQKELAVWWMPSWKLLFGGLVRSDVRWPVKLRDFLSGLSKRAEFWALGEEDRALRLARMRGSQRAEKFIADHND